MQRYNLGHERLVKMGREDGYFRVAWGWFVDYLLFVIDLIWGVIQPIILIFVMLIIRIVLIVVCTALGFYLLYKFITL